MKLTLLTTSLAAVLAAALLAPVQAADEKKDVIEEVMATFHKAPKGVDPVCKRAPMGKVTDDELKNLVAAYKAMAAAKPPKGDQASWKELAGKLLAATESLQRGDADGPAKFREAVNCKACHSAHRAD